MSYDVYFINKEQLNRENIYEVLEVNQPKKEDEIYISKSLMESIITQMESEGLSFEKTKSSEEDYFELNFNSYQLSMFNSQIVLSIPYWHENGEAKIMDEVERIFRILKKFGLKDFDPQTEEINGGPSLIKHKFVETKNRINNNVIVPKKPNQRVLRRIIFILIMIGIGFLLSIFLD